MAIGALIDAILSNVGVLLVIVAAIITLVKVRRAKRLGQNPSFVRILFKELVFYGIGLTFIWAATFHAFFANVVAPSIGWLPSPFEWELAWAEYGIALIAILSLRQGYAMRLAATLVYCVFSFGAAAQHIHEILCCRNLNPGNAGLILWVSDIAVPVALAILAYVARPGSRAVRTRGASERIGK